MGKENEGMSTDLVMEAPLVAKQKDIIRLTLEEKLQELMFCCKDVEDGRPALIEGLKQNDELMAALNLKIEKIKQFLSEFENG